MARVRTTRRKKLAQKVSIDVVFSFERWEEWMGWQAEEVSLHLARDLLKWSEGRRSELLCDCGHKLDDVSIKSFRLEGYAPITVVLVDGDPAKYEAIGPTMWQPQGALGKLRYVCPRGRCGHRHEFRRDTLVLNFLEVNDCANTSKKPTELRLPFSHENLNSWSDEAATV